MQILLLEPFFSGSHRQWAEGYRQHSRHEIKVLSLPGRHWKWRMFGGAISLAEQYRKNKLNPDLILASDMLDLTTFLALTRDIFHDVPTAVYFHENQITYPWSPKDQDPKLQRNNQYGFLNFSSALVADRVFFNSNYHLNSFLGALPSFLRQFPDHHNLDQVEKIAAKSETLPLGLNLQSLNQIEPAARPAEPVILWNHRWEYDKAPESFFEVLYKIQDQGYAFKLIVLGEAFSNSPKIFESAKVRLDRHILHYGFVRDRAQYAQWLHMADILPVTSRQDFFGGSAVEAIYAQCHPLLPDRLAFPEHIPPAFRQDHLYQKVEDLTAMLISLLTRTEQIRSNTHYRNFVAHYDWRILAPLYDERLEKVERKNKNKK